MRRRIAVALTVGLLVGLAGAPGAGAQITQESLVTADLESLTGLRFLQTVAPITLTGTAQVLGSPYVVAVEEVAARGNNPWSVTGRLCGPGDILDLNAGSDCENHPDRLVNSTDDEVIIPGSAIDVSDRSVLQVLGGGTAAAPSGEQDLSEARTLVENTGQSQLFLYTGLYTASGDLTLTPPTETAEGTYTGFFVVDLVQ